MNFNDNEWEWRRGCVSFKPNSVESRDWRPTTSQNVLIRRSSGRNFKEAREIHASGILSRLPINFSIGLISEMCMTLILYQPLRRCNDVNAHKVFTNLFYCVFSRTCWEIRDGHRRVKFRSQHAKQQCFRDRCWMHLHRLDTNQTNNPHLFISSPITTQTFEPFRLLSLFVTCSCIDCLSFPQGEHNNDHS